MVSGSFPVATPLVLSFLYPLPASKYAPYTGLPPSVRRSRVAFTGASGVCTWPPAGAGVRWLRRSV